MAPDPFVANPAIGVIFHALGGLAAGSFYIPYKKVRGWAWETYWLVGGFFSWMIVPWIAASIAVRNPAGILMASPKDALMWSYFFGVLWGIGGLTFGLSMRYLGMSLGYALALGFCAAFGTLIPPIFYHQIEKIIGGTGGYIVLAGVAVCLVGIAICGAAGMRKENELSDEAKKLTIREFDFKKGVWIAIFCGIMSACMSFGLTAAKPIGELTAKHGANANWTGLPGLIVVLAGGFTTNLVWCLYLNIKNGTGAQYAHGAGGSMAANYIFSALAGTIWYFQFFFYTMGQVNLGKKYDFSSWTLHMAFIIIFSNLWGIAFKEWRGTSTRTHRLVFAGILVLIASTIIIGYGNSQAAEKPAEPAAAQKHVQATT